MAALTSEQIQRLETEQNLWFTSVRPDGRPHMAPVWFVWVEGRFYIGTDPASVKSRNASNNPRVAVALEDGTHPIIAEGNARVLVPPYPEAVASALLQKYEWDIYKEEQYHQVIEVTPRRWLAW